MAADLTILNMAKGLAAHASSRQGLIAENVANADTRSFRARDLKPFAEVYGGPGAVRGGPGAPVVSASFAPSAARPGHAGFETPGATRIAATAYEITRIDAASPNGNNVSLEDQMVRGGRAMADHQLALGVLRKSMDLIRMAIGRGR
ncbi:MAG: flagellar basal body rod protein FlgB [Paracoccaceae bacterium]